MARLLAIWGPSKTNLYRNLVSWRFDGVRADDRDMPYEHAAWSLRFYFESRSFRTLALPGATKEFRQEDLLNLPEVRRGNVLVGPVTPLLRARLRPEHIAEATAAALRYTPKAMR